MEKPEVVQSREIFRGRTVRLFVDTLVHQGRRFRREVIRHPGAVAMLVITKEGKVVLERQYRHPTGKWIWEIPAGTLEEGESVKECAIREVKEETGYEVIDVKRLGGCYLAPGYSSEFIHLLLVKAGKKGECKREVGELIEVEEFRLEEVEDMVKRGEIADAKTMAALYLFRLMGYSFTNL